MMSEPAVSQLSDPLAEPSKPPREFSGKLLIVGLFLFAIVLSSGLWVFWYLHTEPFQPLQRAIFRAFPKSNPYVQGGQRRMHKGTPITLRITMRVQFDPTNEAEKPHVEEVVAQLAALARQHIDFAHYDLFELHFIQMRPEHEARKLTITREIAHLLEPPQ